MFPGQGKLTLPKTATGWFTLVFLSCWVGIVLVPLLIISVFSFFSIKQYQMVFEPTFTTWTGLFESGRWTVVVRTLQFAVTITIIELLLAFPFALWLAKGCRSDRARALIITLLTIPFFLDASSRIIVWRSILGTNGVVNTLLMNAGLIDQPITWLLYSGFAVHFGMIGSYFPSAVFPIFLTISLIDDDLIKASSDLGASARQTLLNIILPLAMPGIIGGAIFTVVPLMAAWVEPQLLGGGQVNLLGQSIQSALSNLNYPVAAALSTIVIAILIVLLSLLMFSLKGRMNMASIFQNHGH
ncbi:ABC transporter permease [Agrobacterium sp. ICMP 6402]|uniref:ABC transporter permease n=1 Tax=Agrobacterium sp. ICMP 6402 TaxID=2292443 RepID=UPI001296591B|nr:ABC transporter permease [Agrobacterium sp. ICMP 6402]MQB12427.1 ABC transporter permease [Agrobacterium sp. ICMP 6402]